MIARQPKTFAVGPEKIVMPRAVLVRLGISHPETGILTDYCNTFSTPLDSFHLRTSAGKITSYSAYLKRVFSPGETFAGILSADSAEAVAKAKSFNPRACAALDEAHAQIAELVLAPDPFDHERFINIALKAVRIIDGKPHPLQRQIRAQLAKLRGQ